MLETILKITLVLFMVGNLLDLGLRLDLKVALRGFRDFRFMGLTTLWGFILCPGLGYLLAHLIPLEPPVAMGLILITLGPGGPMLPIMVDRARGDVNYTATFTLYTTLGTVVFLPVMVPVLVKGLTVTTWTVPLGLSVSKVVKLGKLPVRFALAGQYMVHHPDTFGQEWNIQFMMVPVIPKLIKGNLFGE